MIIVGIDPGTKCGWAVLDGSELVSSGVWNLSVRKGEGEGRRYLRMSLNVQHLLSGFSRVPGVTALGYEKVARHAGTIAAKVYHGIVAAAMIECELADVPYYGMPVGTVKKIATGNGRASKEAMVAAFRQRFSREPIDHNEADAAAVALALVYQLNPNKPEGWREG